MSALVTLGGLDVLSGRFSLPLSGISSGDVELGDDQLDLGPTELVFAGDGEPSVAFAVCVSAVADVEGRVHASIVGGRSGGLSRSALAAEAPGLHYDGDPTPVSTWELLSDLAELAGEAIDADQMAALQAFTALSWLREAGPAHRALARVLGHWGLSGRMLPSGDLWAGVETWLAVSAEVIPVDPIDDGWALHVAPLSASFVPGVMVGDKQILRVEYLIGEALRARLHYREAA